MIEKIEEKINSEIEKIIGKENLTIEEINFLIGEKSRLQLEKGREETTEDMKKAMELLFKNQFK